MMQKLEAVELIQQEVGRWSTANFGQQEAKCDDIVRANPQYAISDGGCGEDRVKVSVQLGPLAPLLGMIEEVGELFEVSKPDGPEALDAVGDILIYLCDYTYRSGVPLSSLGDETPANRSKLDKLSLKDGMIVSLRRVVHATLKRLQGIRGFDSSLKFFEFRQQALQEFLYYLRMYSVRYFGRRPASILEEVWDRVSSRDWKKSPATGKSDDDSISAEMQVPCDEERLEPLPTVSVPTPLSDMISDASIPVNNPTVRDSRTLGPCPVCKQSSLKSCPSGAVLCSICGYYCKHN